MQADDGGIEVRLATTEEERRAACALRWEVFVRGAGLAPPHASGDAIETDRFDPHCDHLIAVHRERSTGQRRVVGTYRLLTGTRARAIGGHYCASVYDIDCLLDGPGEVLELGRSCIHPDFRGRGVLNALWKGVADYVVAHGVGILFGRASFQGRAISPARAMTLAYLHHHHRAPARLRASARAAVHVAMDQVPPHAIDHMAARRELPVLLRAYLGVGGHVADGAVVDDELDQLDVLVVVETDALADRYWRHYVHRARIRSVAA